MRVACALVCGVLALSAACEGSVSGPPFGADRSQYRCSAAAFRSRSAGFLPGVPGVPKRTSGVPKSASGGPEGVPKGALGYPASVEGVPKGALGYSASVEGVPEPRAIGCPDPEAILPCTCLTSVENTTYLRCEQLESGDQLEQVFLADFPDPEIAYFHIENSPFLRTLGDIFNGKSIFQMDVYDTGLEIVSEYAFIDSLDTLEVLLISNSYIHEATFPFFTLNLYSNLNSLYLYTTRIQAIPALTSDSLLYFGVTDSLLTSIAADTFKGLSQLTQIFLLQNSIATLETGAFWNIPTLRHVDLSENELTYLESGTFPMADGRVSINLYNNSIAVAEPGTFVMPATTQEFAVFIDFAYNELTIVDEGVFGALFPFLTYMYLDGNPLECGCDVTWLITTPNWTEFVGSYAACADGVLLVDLDPQYYVDNC